MSKIAHITCMVVLLMLTVSCIKDSLSDCPVQYAVEVSIQDKNYSNVNQFLDLIPEDESLPFSHFAGTVYYTLSNPLTGEIVRQSAVLPSNNTGANYTIAFNDVPAGEYELLVWGNLTNNVSAGILHPDNKEHTDIYAAGTKINITTGNHTSKLALARAKGKLVIFYKNFPSDIARIHQTISPVFQSTDAYLNYSGSTSVEKEMDLAASTEMLVAPSLPDGKAKLTLNFYNTSGEPVLVSPETDITLQRNQISALTVDFNDIDNTLEIWMFIDGAWKIVHQLDVD